MKRKYTSESHREISEAAQREVEEMLEHPLSYEEAREQAALLRQASGGSTSHRRYYLNDFHRQHSEALCKELAEQAKHPYTYEQALEQVERIHRESCSANTYSCS